MEVKIMKMLGSIPVVLDVTDASKTAKDGVSPIVDSDILVINPKDSIRNERCNYCVTLLPFRNDMLTLLSNLSDFPGLNDFNDETKSAKNFEMDDIKDALGFFYTKGGVLNPMVKEWVGSKIFKDIMKCFQGSKDDLNSKHVLNKIIMEVRK